MAPVEKQLRAYARRQTGCKALMTHYGIGELTAVTTSPSSATWSRFPSSRQAVRYSGLDVTVQPIGSAARAGHISASGAAGVAVGAV